MRNFGICLAMILAVAVGSPAAAQPAGATIAEMATTPLVRVNIAESLRTPPDEASLTVGTTAREPTAKAAVAANKVKTEKLLATIRSSGIRERDIQTQGIQLSADYRWDTPAPGAPGKQSLVGYVASNSIQIKTRDIDSLTTLLDQLTSAGADSVYGPNFSISDPAPIRREARKRAMVRGAAEATEYAVNAGFTRVRLLSVEEGSSYRGTDYTVPMVSAPPPPPPPPPGGRFAGERDGGGVVAPGQIETQVQLNLLYRMER